MIKDQITSILRTATQEFSPTEAVLTSSVSRGRFGDYSTNLAFSLSEVKSSNEVVGIAKKIVAKIKKNDLFSSVEVSSGGFINFHLINSVWLAELQKILEKRTDYHHSDLNKGKKARVEFISANPTGPLHIGNARGGPIGDSLASILASSGYQVLREYFHNDLGGQVEKLGESLLNIKNGAKLEDQEYKGSYLLEIVEKMAANVAQAEKAGRWATELLLKEIINECSKIGIKYDKVYKESDFEENSTKAVLAKLKDKGLLKEKDGAVWFASKDEFLEDREAVVIKSNGQPTYFANDIAYHNLKFSEGYDLIVDELGSGHDGHIPKLKSAISALGYDIDKFKVVVHQNVRVKRGNEVVKMSKRAGNFVSAAEVIGEVGKDAFRFFMLQRAPETHMDFDLDLAKKQSNENPVYYVQYAYARMSSILNKASPEKEDQEVDFSLIKEPEEIELIKKLSFLPELVSDISASFAVHQLTGYAIELADQFHHFYEKVRVISDDEDVTRARLNLVLAAKIVLGQTLALLGVSAPERM